MLKKYRPRLGVTSTLKFGLRALILPRGGIGLLVLEILVQCIVVLEKTAKEYLWK